MTRDEADTILTDEYGAELPSRSTREWADEVAALRTANRALDSQLRAAKFRFDELDGAANTRVHQLEGEAATWRIAALAMAGVWLVTMGGILWGML